MDPLRELATSGTILLGGAFWTWAEKLPDRGVIPFAGNNRLWRVSERSIHDSVRNALRLALPNRFPSLAFPWIGTGSDSFPPTGAQRLMLAELDWLFLLLTVRIVVLSSSRS